MQLLLDLGRPGVGAGRRGGLGVHAEATCGRLGGADGHGRYGLLGGALVGHDYFPGGRSAGLVVVDVGLADRACYSLADHRVARGQVATAAGPLWSLRTVVAELSSTVRLLALNVPAAPAAPAGPVEPAVPAGPRDPWFPLSAFNTLGLICDVPLIRYLDAASPVPARLKNNATQAMGRRWR